MTEVRAPLLSLLKKTLIRARNKTAPCGTRAAGKLCSIACPDLWPLTSLLISRPSTSIKLFPLSSKVCLRKSKTKILLLPRKSRQVPLPPLPLALALACPP